MVPRRSSWMAGELELVRKRARRFFEDESASLFGEPTSTFADRDVWTRAGEAGMLCASIPAEYGGGGGSFLHEVVISEEHARSFTPLLAESRRNILAAQYINTFGTPAQKQSWLPRMASGDLVGVIAMNEPTGGAVLDATRPRAIRDGDSYVIDGTIGIVLDSPADLVLVLATAESRDRPTGASLIGVETHRLPGLRLGPARDRIEPDRPEAKELHFDEVRVPAANLLGEVEGHGAAQVMRHLREDWLLLTVAAVSTMERVVELTIENTNAQTPVQLDSGHGLAECAALATIGRGFLDDCIQRHLRNELDMSTCAMASWWITQQQTMVNECLQVGDAPRDLLARRNVAVTTASQVRSILEGGLRGEWPSSEQVASRLSLSLQHVRRLLREEGTSVRQIRDDILRDAAVVSLLRGQESISDLSERLGFSEPSAFRRAFRRWTGSPPSVYRPPGGADADLGG